MHTYMHTHTGTCCMHWGVYFLACCMSLLCLMRLLYLIPSKQHSRTHTNIAFIHTSWVAINSYTQTPTHIQILCIRTYVYHPHTHTHTHTLIHMFSLSHTHTHTHTHPHTPSHTYIPSHAYTCTHTFTCYTYTFAFPSYQQHAGHYWSAPRAWGVWHELQPHLCSVWWPRGVQAAEGAHL